MREERGTGYSMCTRICAQTLQHERQDKTIAQLSIKPAMLVSSVQAVVACYVTAPRVCTLVLFIIIIISVILCVCFTNANGVMSNLVSFINPRRACAVSVTVLVLCACVSVCSSVPLG